MPVIPTFGSRASIESAPLARVNPAAMSAGADEIGRAAARTAALFGELAERERQAREAGAIAQGRAAHAEALAGLRGDLETAPAGTDILGAWDARRVEIRRQIAQTIPDQRVRAMFERDAVTAEARDRLEIVRFAARRTGEAQRADLMGELEVWAGRAAAATNPGDRAAAVDGAMAAIGARIGTGVLPADDGERMRQQFRGRMAQAEVLRDINGSPETALRRLAAGEYRGIDPVQQERLAAQARTAIQTRATQADTALRRQEHVQRLRANEAEKAFQDAQRVGDRAGMQQALAVLRRDGQAGQYASAADSLYGRLEPPTTPQMSAWLETRLRDRGQPLTRAELEEARASRSINDTLYRQGLERLSSREDARFREAEQFVERALGVPSATIPDRELRPVQRQARQQSNQIVNDLVLERRSNPDVDPLGFVQERLRGAEDPQVAVRRANAQQALTRMAPEVQTPEGLDRIIEQWAAYQRALASRGWFGSRPPVPRVGGAAVTADMIVRWRLLQEQAGLREPQGGQGAQPR